ncbi:MAG: SMP-30/gluconolactonase/LRE family protein [Gammaproteobacteria bacterium]|nr:SMP-30/gluconolactonase/LRE family protein [Gammaproteobacteria bacterium]
MNRLLKVTGAILLVALSYLLFWPVPIEPVAWHAPEDRGLVDPFLPNDQLQAATTIDLQSFEGPEDATLGHDNSVYVTTSSGHVLRIRNRKVEKFALVGGRPLGIEAAKDGSLVIANAYSGLQRIDASGDISTLLGSIDGATPVYPNNLALAHDGRIYFSEASSKFGAEKYRGTYDASLLDIMEHGGHGSVIEFDPASGIATMILDGLNYANGVAISDDNQFIVVAETGSYRVLKHWLAGPRRGETEILLENLPGFPDNIKTGRNGRFWLGLAAPRNALLDRVSDKPWLRKVIQRLPAAVRPKAVPSSHVIAFNGQGDILMNMHEPNARFPTLTGVLETDRALYLTTLFGGQLPVVAKSDL